ncbi:drug/metabolite transporter (DMT)-like permease [Pedobacter sp. CG_S7]|uniref:DMT family transporter n=1 Tax=Pedobacter sp. CG_S7 TaxID=3143930 RepID=UPI003391225B
MIYILISICCSVTVAVLLKLARRYKINIIQTVSWNYLFAIALGCFFFKPQFNDLVVIPSPTYIILGILLPVIFWFLAASIKHIGIVKSDIAQRLSLFIPILAAFFLFKEQMNSLKLIGLLLGFTAILLVLIKKQNSTKTSTNWLYPIIVFLGFGVIDVLFKKIAQIQTIPYTTSLIIIFSIAFLVSILSILYLIIYKNEKLAFINFICGGILGVFNFGNILFYLKAHQSLAQSPSTVFAAMNIGVIILGSIIGIYLFKEKFSKINYIGLTLALGSIILITLSQIYAV